MRRALVLTVALLIPLSLALASPAAAQSEASSTGPVPGFATLDRVDGSSKVTGFFGWGFFDDEVFGAPDADVSAQRIDIHGQFVHPVHGVGGYVVFDYARYSVDSPIFEDSQEGLGNLELGGIYEIRGGVPVILRVGLGLPTSDEDDIAPSVGALMRFTDVMVAFPETTTLRLSASPLYRHGQLVFRGDVGIDVPVDEPDGAGVDPIGRVNVGLGFDSGQVAILGELVNVIDLGDNEAGGIGDDDDMFHVLSVTGRYTGSPVVQPGLTVSVPLNGDYQDVLDFAILLTADFLIDAG